MRKTAEKKIVRRKNMRKQKRPSMGMKMIYYYICLWWRLKKNSLWKMLHSLLRQVWCVPSMGHMFLFTRNTWIGDYDASCHITNDNTSLFDIIDIDELIQGSSGNISATKMASFMSMSNKLMELNGSILYGLWSFVPKHVHTCFLWHVNS